MRTSSRMITTVLYIEDLHKHIPAFAGTDEEKVL